ncbi:MAG TPA: YkvA family protein [Nocardioidaceae bacterium]|nr:YkvA family protein [Nocardioidaceae bacterium]
MTEPSWKPLFRTPASTVTKVLRSPAFLHARQEAAGIIDDPAALRSLALLVEGLDHENAPLSAVADRVSAAVHFLRTIADELDSSPRVPVAGVAARERLLVASLHYLVTPDDLVPDFRPGGYIDDVLLLTWVFGAAVNELSPHLADLEVDDV